MRKTLILSLLFCLALPQNSYAASKSITGVLLQRGDQAADLVDGMQVAATRQVHHHGADGHQREIGGIAQPVTAFDMSQLAGFVVVEGLDVMAEGLDQVAARGHDLDIAHPAEAGEEVVAADMASEAAVTVHGPRQQVAEQQDGAVAQAETVFVIERLEVVEVEIDQGILPLHPIQRPRHPVDDDGVAGQSAERILVAGGHQILFIDDPQQGVGRQEPHIGGAVDDHDAVRALHRGIGLQDVLGLAVDVGHGAADDEVLEGAAKALIGDQLLAEGRVGVVLQLLLAHDADRLAGAVDHRKEGGGLVGPETLEHLFHGSAKRQRRQPRHLIGDDAQIRDGAAALAPGQGGDGVVLGQ